MTIFGNWWPRAATFTASDIRRELDIVGSTHAQTISSRNRLALEALKSDVVQAKFRKLDEAAATLSARMQVLQAALPQAEAIDAASAEDAEATVLEIGRASCRERVFRAV